MFPIRVKVCQESDLRMLGLLARNIQRVLPVTQADIDAAAALGKGWVVWKVIEVSDPLDNLRGGTQLIIKQNSITPGQNVRRVIFVSGPGGETVVIGPAPSPLLLPDAIANSLSYVKAYGGTEQNGTPTPDAPVDIVCNNGALKVKDSELPVGYKRLTGITYDSNTYYETNEKLYGSDTLTITLSGTVSAGRNVIGAYSGSGDDARNFSLYIYGNGSSSNSYLRHGTKTSRPRYGTGTRTLVMGPTGTDGFLTNVTYEEEDFETTSTFRIGTLPNSTSAKFDGNMIGNITVSNRLKYIPCERVSDGEIGYYETFTGTFLEPQGGGTPVSMGYDTSYMTEIYTDGTVETIEDTIGNTATAEMLLKVGDYQDVQSIIDGVVTRKVGVKVLDGTEDGWSKINNSFGNTALFADKKREKSTLFCSHFQYDSGSTSTIPDGCFGCASTSAHTYFRNNALSTAEDWKQWLVAQYNAGTPVIVLYPLATPTTESVAGQTLQVTDGDNTLEITQASMSGLELEAEYEQGVEALVEEIEP